MSAGATRFVNAVRRLAGRGDRAEVGTVEGYSGGNRYRVLVRGTIYDDVPAAGDVEVSVGQSVAVLVSESLGRPVAVLGALRRGGE
jgi:hypothetical protein